MKNIKKITILLLFLSLFVFISCSNKKTTGTEDSGRTLSYYAGNWWGNTGGTGEEHIFTINADNSFTMVAGGEGIEVPSSYITRDSDTSYTVSMEGQTLNLTFSSDTQGKYSVTQEGQNPVSFDITKK